MTLILLTWFISSYVLFVGRDYYKQIRKDIMTFEEPKTDYTITKERITRVYKKASTLEKLITIVWAPVLIILILLFVILLPFSKRKKLIVISSDDESVVIFPEIDLILWWSDFYEDYIPWWSKQDFLNSYIGETDKEKREFVIEAYNSLNSKTIKY